MTSSLGNRLEDLDNACAEDKLIKSMNNIKRILPFYSSAYMALDKEIVEAGSIESNVIKTMGVTEDKLYYNREFVEKMPMIELNFVNLHEIIHLVFKHPTRGLYKDRKLYNIACDLVVNTFLVEELNNNVTDSYKNEWKKSVSHVKMPDNALYFDGIDLNTETADTIYNCLYAQAESNGYISDSNSTTIMPSKSYEFFYKPAHSLKAEKIVINVDRIYKCVGGQPSGLNNEGQGNGKNGQNKQNQESKIEVNIGEVFTNESNTDISNDKANQALNKIKMKADMDSINSKSCSGGTCSLEIELNKELSSKLDWKKFIQRFLIKMKSTDSSFSNPDKRMFYQNAIYPGQSYVDLGLKDVKLCIDVSGSISNREIAFIIGQIKDLTSKYRVDAEIISWDTKIHEIIPLNNKTELKNKRLSGRGGTDPYCLFEYFESNKCSKKPSLVIIFTDGGFEDNFEKFKSKYKNNTLWIMSESGLKNFKPLFGKVGYPVFPAREE